MIEIDITNLELHVLPIIIGLVIIVRFCLSSNNVFSFYGRINRKIFAMGLIFSYLISEVFTTIFHYADNESVLWPIVIIFNLLPIIILWFNSLLIKRLHDIGKSGWWVLLFLLLATLGVNFNLIRYLHMVLILLIAIIPSIKNDID